jgi:hypothetical protein
VDVRRGQKHEIERIIARIAARPSLSWSSISKAAKALGLTVLHTLLLVSADEVID